MKLNEYCKHVLSHATKFNFNALGILCILHLHFKCSQLGCKLGNAVVVLLAELFCSASNLARVMFSTASAACMCPAIPLAELLRQHINPSSRSIAVVSDDVASGDRRLKLVVILNCFRNSLNSSQTPQHARSHLGGIITLSCRPWAL